MGTKVVGSNMPDFASDQLKPSKAGYGQNGFGGASSDTPGENTRSGFLPGVGTPVNDQLRKVSTDQYPPTFGMKNPTKR